MEMQIKLNFFDYLDIFQLKSSRVSLSIQWECFVPHGAKVTGGWPPWQGGNWSQNATKMPQFQNREFNSLV